jgi:hypothetical protein
MKNSVDVSNPGHTEMHYVTHISHLMQKHMFILMCPIAHFVESVLVPPELEKQCIDVLGPKRTTMDYVTRRYHTGCKNTSSA